MKIRISIILAVLAASLFASCKSEKKLTYYSDIYAEKPTTIYVAPINDRAARRPDKYEKDKAYNLEVDAASAYLRQTISQPLVSQGYYVVGPLAAAQIAKNETRSYRQLVKTDLSSYYNDYGVDAVLFTTIHRWKEGNGTWTVYVEYILRSTKTYAELMHTWVEASKVIFTDMKKDPVPMRADRLFAKRLDISVDAAQRCILVANTNHVVLKDLPISSSRRQFETDQYLGSNSAYIRLTCNETGDVETAPMSMEAFEDACFTK